jgi:large subunit ribosomal protein L21
MPLTGKRHRDRIKSFAEPTATFFYGESALDEQEGPKDFQGSRILKSAAEISERSHMYAVIKTGGKQYKVAAGEKIKVEQIAADVGQEIVLDQVLAVGDGAELKVGTPWVAGASVKATVVAQGRHDKVRIFKMRRRKHYQKHGGHRQPFTELEISSVNA